MTTAFTTYLRNTIGFDTNARANAIRDLGINNFASLTEYEEEDVKILCNGARKGDPAMQINAILEKRLKLACYGARIYEIIGRDINAQSLSINRLKDFDRHKALIKNHKDPKDEIPKVSKSYSIDKALDALPNILRARIGVRGIALSYVIRQDATPPMLDPLDNHHPYAGSSGSMMEELIKYTPHDGIGWDEDNATVFGILFEMVKDVPMASSLKRHQRQRNGRNAYLSLVQHNLGTAQWDRVISKAEETQNIKVWNGKNHRFTLRAHINHHRDSYNDMVRASEHIDYEVPNDHTRVSRLLKSIHAEHIASIAAAKTTIEATTEKRNDFESAADFLCLCAPASKAMQRDHRISALNQEQESQLQTLSNTQVEDRFYTKEEYSNLSQEAKQKLYLLREQRGKGEKRQGGGKRKGKGGSRNQIKKLKMRIAALESKKQDDDDHSNDNNTGQRNDSGTISFNQRGNKRTGGKN